MAKGAVFAKTANFVVIVHLQTEVKKGLPYRQVGGNVCGISQGVLRLWGTTDLFVMFCTTISAGDSDRTAKLLFDAFYQADHFLRDIVCSAAGQEKSLLDTDINCVSFSFSQ